jgi:hypothetical protein
MTSPSKAQARMVPADQPDLVVEVTPDGEAAERVRSVLWMLRDPRGAFVSKETALEMVTDALDGPDVIAAEEARPVAPSAPATPAVGTGTSGVGSGAPAGAGEVGLGAAIRALYDTDPDRPVYESLALRAEVLERDLVDAKSRSRGGWVDCQHNEDHVVREALQTVDRLNDENTRQSETIGRVRDLVPPVADGGPTDDEPLTVGDVRAALDGAL